MVNFFYLDHDPHLCAQFYCNKHVVKIPIEIAQILSKVHRDIGESKQLSSYYKSPRNLSVKFAIYRWVIQSKANYIYAVRLAIALVKEYKFRYDKNNHLTENVLYKLEQDVPKNMPDIGQTLFMMGNKVDMYQYLSDDILQNNRYAYVDIKCKNDKWTKRGKPDWFIEIENKLKLYKENYRKKIIQQLENLSNIYNKKIGFIIRIGYDSLFAGKWQRKSQLMNKIKKNHRLFDQLTFPHLYYLYEILIGFQDRNYLLDKYIDSLRYRKNIEKLKFPNKKFDYRKYPNYYIYLSNTSGYDTIHPYVKELESLNIDELYEKFIDYLDAEDFIGADVVRKRVQKLYKKSDKYDLIMNNIDYVKWKMEQNYMLTDPYKPETKIFSNDILTEIQII